MNEINLKAKDIEDQLWNFAVENLGIERGNNSEKELLAHFDKPSQEQIHDNIKLPAAGSLSLDSYPLMDGLQHGIYHAQRAQKKKITVVDALDSVCVATAILFSLRVLLTISGKTQNNRCSFASQLAQLAHAQTYKNRASVISEWKARIDKSHSADWAAEQLYDAGVKLFAVPKMAEIIREERKMLGLRTGKRRPRIK
jgi:hypothetical protein